jgi:5-methylthioribose kinase
VIVVIEPIYMGLQEEDLNVAMARQRCMCARCVQGDTAAKLAASELKRKFMTQADALLHGDLHTGE